MVEKVKFNNIEDYLKKYNERNIKGVYFYRLISWSPKIEKFLIAYLKEIEVSGIFIKERIKNPEQEKTAFFIEKMGTSFKMEQIFFKDMLKKWLPNLNEKQQLLIADSLFKILRDLENEGKNINILKNIYIKFMCWFYYKFQFIFKYLGSEVIPKVLFEGYTNDHELRMLNILSKSGCDILLLQYNGDDEYLKIDKNSKFSNIVPNIENQKFPLDFSVMKLKTLINENNKKEKEFKTEQPKGIMSTNTWISSNVFDDSLKEKKQRGTNESFYYNMFVKIYGTEDKNNMMNILLKWKLKLESNKRNIVLIEERIKNPDSIEVEKIIKNNIKDRKEFIKSISNNISLKESPELEKLLKKSFIEIMNEFESERIQKLYNTSIIILCWLNRYISKLFPLYKLDSYPIFIYYGCCQNENEEIFLKILSRIPVDVFLICIDKNLPCELQDKFLFEQVYEDSMPIEKFPTRVENIKFGTTAYNAERELDTLMYKDTGIYRKNQFKKAIPIRLETTYEEIAILWGQEAKYRPNFETFDDRVMIPLICSKISGIPNGSIDFYWDEIEKFLKEDVYLVDNLPYIKNYNRAVFNQNMNAFIKEKKIQIDKIKSHPSYEYRFIREEMQHYIFEAAQKLLDSRIIAGTFVNGMEYTILNTILTLNKEILRMIQKYDFTKKAPKLVIIDTKENIGSKEDAIITAFLSFIGFDILLFVPTGYQSLESYYTVNLFSEHQIGEYIYDLRVPEFDKISKNFKIKRNVFNKFFRR